MTIPEIQQAKKLLEQALTELVQQFENETDVVVFSLNVYRPYGKPLSAVTASIKIPDAPAAKAVGE